MFRLLHEEIINTGPIPKRKEKIKYLYLLKIVGNGRFAHYEQMLHVP